MSDLDDRILSLADVPRDPTSLWSTLSSCEHEYHLLDGPARLRKSINCNDAHRPLLKLI